MRGIHSLPAPCCSPAEFGSLDMLYFDDLREDGSVQLRAGTLANVIATSCRCGQAARAHIETKCLFRPKGSCIMNKINKQNKNLLVHSSIPTQLLVSVLFFYASIFLRIQIVGPIFKHHNILVILNALSCLCVQVQWPLWPT